MKACAKEQLLDHLPHFKAFMTACCFTLEIISIAAVSMHATPPPSHRHDVKGFLTAHCGSSVRTQTSLSRMYSDPFLLPGLTPSVAASFAAGKPSEVVRPARGTHNRSLMMVKSDANVLSPCWIECGDCEVPDPRARPVL